jgi:hypothetical protein
MLEERSLWRIGLTRDHQKFPLAMDPNDRPYNRKALVNFPTLVESDGEIRVTTTGAAKHTKD